jgi:osmotically-inducible protein OsmY
LSDTQIKRTIEDRLSLSPDVDRSGITVAVTDGVATLSGTAGSWIGRREAVLDARQSHATAVVDHLDLKRGIWRSP